LVGLFLSTFVNKVDRKGRVSVPASFRAALAGQSFAGIVVYRSFKNSAIEGSGYKRLEEGQQVEFEVGPGRKGDEARSVRVLAPQ